MVFTIMCFSSFFSVSSSFLDPQITPKWLSFIFCASAMAIIWPFLPNSTNPKKEIHSYILILVTACLSQAIYGLIKHYVFHSDQWLAGSFDNPAGFAAGLCATVPFITYYVGNSANKTIRYLGISVLLIVCASTALSLSRAGIISMAVIGALMLQSKFRVIKTVRSKILIALVFIILASGLYLLKKDSANGRLLIWRCTVEMIKDKPVCGFGPGGFIANYMDYQARYFEENPNSEYSMLADTVISPFNEYLHILVDYGIVGFIVLIIAMGYCWVLLKKNRDKNALMSTAGYCLFSIAAFSLFSYPLNYSIVWLSIILSVYILIKNAYPQIRVLRSVKISIGIIGVGIGFIAFKYMQAEIAWQKASKKDKTEQILSEYEVLYKTLNRNRLFLYNYMMELHYNGDYTRSLVIANECRRIWADYYLELIIGENYLQKQLYREAEQHFNHAANMCPSRFVPLYKITKIYIETGCNEEALTLAHKIINKEVKVPSATIRAIKLEMAKIINENEEVLLNHEQ